MWTSSAQVRRMNVGRRRPNTRNGPPRPPSRYGTFASCFRLSPELAASDTSHTLYKNADGALVKVATLTDEDRRTIVRWIDLGCPVDWHFDATHPEQRGYGWMLDDQRPTLTLTQPRAGTNDSITRVLIGMHDYDTGLNLDTLHVSADFAVDGMPACSNLASRFKAKSQGVWELILATPLQEVPHGKLLVSVKDRQGNISRVERSLSVAQRPKR